MNPECEALALIPLVPTLFSQNAALDQEEILVYIDISNASSILLLYLLMSKIISLDPLIPWSLMDSIEPKNHSRSSIQVSSLILTQFKD